MPDLKCAVAGVVLSVLICTPPAAAGGYPEDVDYYAYTAEPGLVEAPAEEKVIQTFSEVRIRYRGAPGYRYGAAFVKGPPDLWRQREVAYDAIFTRDKRIIYDSNRAAQTRAAVEFYGPKFHYRPKVHYHRHGSIKDYGPPPAAFFGPVFDPAGTCGTFRFWNGEACVDARFYSRYKNPYKWRYLHR